MTTTTLDAQNPELEQETAALITSTSQLVVTDAASYALAGERMTGLTTLKKKIEGWFEPLVDAAHKAHKALTTRRATSVKPIDAEITRLREQRDAWRTEQDRLQREREQQAALEEKRRQEEQAVADAQLLVRQGQCALAEAVIEQAIATPAPVVVLPSLVPKDMPQRTLYKWRVVNLALVPREFLVLDESKLTRYANAMKEAARVPGVEFYTKDTDIVRT